MSGIRMFISSCDSLQFFPDNKPNDFTIRLPDELHLEGEWTCTLRNLKCVTTLDTDLYVFCDVVEESYVRNRKLPILQYIPGEQGKMVGNFESDLCAKLSRKDITTIRIYIRDFHLREAPLAGERTTCTLHFLKS